MEKLNCWLNEKQKELSQKEFSLVKKATKILCDNICEGKEFPWTPYRCIRPFGENPINSIYTGIWNWDSAFHAIGVLRWDAELAKEQILSRYADHYL